MTWLTDLFCSSPHPCSHMHTHATYKIRGLKLKLDLMEQSPAVDLTYSLCTFSVHCKVLWWQRLWVPDTPHIKIKRYPQYFWSPDFPLCGSRKTYITAGVQGLNQQCLFARLGPTEPTPWSKVKATVPVRCPFRGFVPDLLFIDFSLFVFLDNSNFTAHLVSISNLYLS